MKKILFLTILSFILSATNVFANQAERIGNAKRLLGNLEQRSVAEIARDLNKTDFPQGNLAIFEAVAKTYHDLVISQEINTDEQKKWLHGMIMMNMAYFQFGGTGKERTNQLNALIRSKIKSYLPAELMKNEELFYSLDYLE